MTIASIGVLFCAFFNCAITQSFDLFLLVTVIVKRLNDHLPPDAVKSNFCRECFETVGFDLVFDIFGGMLYAYVNTVSVLSRHTCLILV